MITAGALLRSTDDGPGGLLEALSALGGVSPVECRARDGQGDTYVLFRYGRSERELAIFVAGLSSRLRAAAPDVRFVLGCERVAGGTELLALLAVPSAALPRLARAVRDLGVRA